MTDLVAIPVYNEADTVPALLQELRCYYPGHILFIDDGSSDCSPCILKQFESETISVIQHTDNKGYGRALRTSFEFAQKKNFSALVTMDADWQHEPRNVKAFFDQLPGYDIISGSRYLREENGNDAPPADRMRINAEITKVINEITGFNLTDAFCGFKAYNVAALGKLKLNEDGYAMPLQFWVQAKHFGLTVKEIPVPRIYSDPKRQFAGPIKDPEIRLKYYHEIIERELKRWKI